MTAAEHGSLLNTSEIDLARFRADVRKFCEENLPADIRRRVLAGGHVERQDYVLWQKMLAKRGWLGGAWPKEYGGQAWTPVQSYIFQEECDRAGAPWLLPFGIDYVGPVIFTFGSEEQKRRYLPGILSADTFWCQGYSEPNAGSDLANLSTRAVRDGDSYIVNGSKIWTTMAHWADMIFCLVRTNPDVRPQAGISFLLIPMQAPGVTVRPIWSIDGEHHLNQVFFDDVRVPVDNRIGDEGRGWHYAKFLLGNERLLCADVGRSKRILARAKQRLAASDASRHVAMQLRARCAHLEIDLLALEWMTLRLLQSGEPGAEVSILKIRGSTILQQIGELLVDVLGQVSLEFEPDRYTNLKCPDDMRSISEFLYLRAATIYGGTNEVQRGILAKQALGLRDDA